MNREKIEAAINALESMRSKGSLLPQRLQSGHWKDYEVVRVALMDYVNQSVREPKPKDYIVSYGNSFDQINVDFSPLIKFLDGREG